MTIESTISRADIETANGRLWRAREILGSSIPTYGYSREIFNALATVLLKMGDELEAGKYFLLSIDIPTETERVAIDVFLGRCNDRNYRTLLAKFPAAARLENRDDYPEYLRKHLLRIDAPPNLGQQQIASNVIPTRVVDRLLLIGCSLFAFSAIACIIIGAYTIFSWLFFGPMTP